MSSNSEVSNIRQAAAFIGAHEQTARRLARRGAIPAFKVGKNWRFRKEALERWFEEQRSSSEPVSPQIVNDRTDESPSSPGQAGRGPSMSDSLNAVRRHMDGHGHWLHGHDGLVLTGRSIVPRESSPTGRTGAMILEVALDSATHRVLTVACEGLPKLGQEMLTALLVGISLPDALHAAKERLTSRYYSELREPVIGALEEIGRKYGELSRQITRVGMDGTGSVLIIDDDEKICRALRRVVEGFGCSVETATSGAEGLARVVSEVPDLILLDLLMPEMNGPQFLDELRKIHPNLPVVIVTGFPDGDLMKAAACYAPVMLLTKPVASALLERTIRAVMGDKMSKQSAG